MKTKSTILVVLICLMVGLSSSAFSQDMDISKQVYFPGATKEQTESNLDELIDPLLDLFGFYSGGGLYHTADIHGLGGFDVGVRLITMMIRDDQKPDLPFPEGTTYQYDGGVFRDVSLVPLPVLQASIGLPGNLEATGRFFTYPMGEGEESGNITLIGLGLKYGLLQNMVLPRVSVVAAYHYLTVPDEFDFGDVSSVSLALIASKGFLFFDIYGGVGIDYNKFEVDFELPDPIGKVTKTYKKENIRYNLGVKIKPIPLVYVHADYNFGEAQGFNVGLGISFR